MSFFGALRRMMAFLFGGLGLFDLLLCLQKTEPDLYSLLAGFVFIACAGLWWQMAEDEKK